MQFQGMFAAYGAVPARKAHHARTGSVVLLSGARFGYRYVHQSDHAGAAYEITGHEVNVLALGTWQVFEAVEFDSAGDVGHAWLVVSAPGEVAGLFRLAGTGPAGAVADEEPRVEDLQQEGGQGQVKLVRGGKAAVMVLAAAARACGKLILSGGMPAAFTPAPMSWQMAW